MRYVTPIILPILFGVCLVAAIYSYQATNEQATFAPKIAGPAAAEIGELVILTASGADNYDWLKSAGHVEGNRVFFTTPVPGTYTFVCAATRGGEVRALEHCIVVKGPSDPPTPEPEELNDFEIMVKSWVPEGTEPGAPLRLATSFALVAASDHANIDALLKVTVLGNRAALGPGSETWKPFFASLEAYCDANLQDADLTAHLNLWKKIAAALRK